MENKIQERKKTVKGYPRHTMRIMKGNFAASEAAQLCRVDFVPLSHYPSDYHH